MGLIQIRYTVVNMMRNILVTVLKRLLLVGLVLNFDWCNADTKIQMHNMGKFLDQYMSMISLNILRTLRT